MPLTLDKKYKQYVKDAHDEIQHIIDVQTDQSDQIFADLCERLNIKEDSRDGEFLFDHLYNDSDWTVEYISIENLDKIYVEFSNQWDSTKYNQKKFEKAAIVIVTDGNHFKPIKNRWWSGTDDEKIPNYLLNSYLLQFECNLTKEDIDKAIKSFHSKNE